MSELCPTLRLEQQDPWLRRFESEVLAIEGDEVMLRESAFYPESGGQKADTGTLRFDGVEVRVTDVQIADGVVRHRIEGSVAVGVRVEGTIDAPRRREHMALHTGQHMLSRALFDLGARTLSSRLGAEATIDLDVALTEEQLRAAEARVQAAVDEDREVRVHYPSDEELASMSLRRTVKVDEDVRVVEVEGFDWTPCGGTHCTRTGQVGVMRILEWQRKKGGQRVTFACGPRARRILVERSETLEALASRFTCGPLDVTAAVDKLERVTREAREGLGLMRAAWVAATLRETGSERRVVRVFEGIDADAVRSLAAALTESGDRLCVLGARGPDAVHVIVARGPQSDVHAGQLLRALAEATGGRGGGRPERAEGRLPADADLEAAVEVAS